MSAALEQALTRALGREEEARAGVARARAELQTYLAAEALRAWWDRHREERQVTDSLRNRWVVRSARPSRDGRYEELELVGPIAHVQLRGDRDPSARGRRLTQHRVTVMEQTRRVSVEANERPVTIDRVRLAAGERPE